MLVVIALIAVLVAILIPTISNSTKKAKAASDAANLRTVIGTVNSELVGTDFAAACAVAEGNIPECKTFPGAKMWVAYDGVAALSIYYCDSGKYYPMEYFNEIASTGSATTTPVSSLSGQTCNLTDAS